MKVLEWLRRWGGWVLGLIATLVAAVALLVRRQRPTAQPPANPEKKRAEDVAEQAELEAKKELEDVKTEASRRLDEDLAVLVDKQKESTRELVDDPKALNERLHQAGDDARKP